MRLVSRPVPRSGGAARVPGDKSISHRALILGGLAGGETRVTGLLEGEDVLATARAVRAFGAEVTRTGEGAWTVRGAEWRSPDSAVDCGNSGTGVRLLMGAAASFPLRATFDGDASLRGRPMARVTGPLARMGARFEGGERLPLTLTGGRLTGIEYRSPHASAQVKSALLLAGMRAEGDTAITEPQRSRDHSERMLRAFGADVTEGVAEGGGWRAAVRPGRLTARPVEVPGDPSSAAFPLVAALIARAGRLRLDGVLLNPLRTGLFAALQRMGAALSTTVESEALEPVGSVHASASSLTAIDTAAADAPAMIDEFPILAVAAAFAEGTSVFRGVGELRVKESDRVALMVGGLRACGVEAEAGADWFAVHGRGGDVRGGAEIETHGDHRIAMSFLVLGLGARRPVTVRDAEMIATSFPGFAALMNGLGADIAGVT